MGQYFFQITKMDKFCLKWNEFDRNFRDYFKNMRQDKILFDVTLATDDGHLFQAHKIILSAGSEFFGNIFQKNNHSNMLIYLKGIDSNQLAPVLDFMYNGEAFINQEDLNIFTEITTELQLKGLECDNVKEDVEVSETEEVASESSKKMVDESGELAPLNSNKHPFSPEDAHNMQPLLQEMVEKNGNGVWKCKFCGKMRNRNTDILRHAQKHMEGVQEVSIDCHICKKTFTSKSSLQSHISTIHSGIYSCDICGLSGMNRMTYRDHKRSQH